MSPAPNSAESGIPLAAEFPSFDESDWRALVIKSAHGRPDVDLASETDDGIAIGPLYAADFSGEIVSGRGTAAWQIVQRIDLPDIGGALRQIEEDIGGGATAIELVFATSPTARGAGLPAGVGRDLDRIAALLRQNALTIRVDAGEDTAAITADLLRRTEDGGGGNGSPALTAAFDPFATMALQGGLRHRIEDVAGSIADLFHELERAAATGSAMTADGRLWHAGGASEVQELAATVAAYLAGLRLLGERGIDPGRAAARIGIALAADADQFLTIAKFRAARLLVGLVTETVGLAGAVTVHGETAWRMMSRYDAHGNILRTTTAALAAGLGGANSVTVLPFDSAARLSDSFARRLARNGQTILIQEAGLAAVADPGAGSGAIEALTNRLAEQAWDRFRSIEAEGGLLAALRSGTAQRKVAIARERRLNRVATRALPLTGITSFPQIASPPPDASWQVAAPPARMLAETVEPLIVTRMAEPFEALRRRTDRLAAAGKRPAVFLQMLGPRAETAAIASEVRQLFAGGGISAVVGPTPASGESVGAAFAASGAAAACICAASKIEEAEIAALARALRTAGAKLVGLAGGGAARSDLDYSIEPDANVVELLGNILQRFAADADESPSTQ